MTDQRVVAAAPHDLAEEVDVAELGGEREVETAAKCVGVESERQIRWGPARVRFVGGQRLGQTGQVRRVAGVDDVEILRETSGSVGRGRGAADDDEVGPCVDEGAEEAG